MCLTKYLKTFENADEPGSLIFFSAKKGSIISLPAEMLSDIESGRLSEEELRSLRDLGFICENPQSERKEMLGFVDDLNDLTRTFAAKVVMNLDCNLACRYCFEGQRKGKFYMSKETADLFVRFVEQWIKGLDGRTGEEQIVVTFYGGEPLLSAALVAYLSGTLKTLAEKNSITYVAYMVTNGILLTPLMADRLVPVGLKGAAVTLDGLADIHDLSRPFKSGGGSFEGIFGNLKAVYDIIGLQIGGNYMSDNYREFPRLLDFMLANGLTTDKVDAVKFNPVTGESADYGPADFNEGCMSVNEQWFFEASVYMSEEIRRRGFKMPRSISPGVCSLDIRDNYLINYDGSIYKCPSLVGREEFKIGDLRSGVKYETQPQGKDCWKNEECLNCTYLPLCFGGCRHMKLVRDGNMDSVDCKKPYLDATLEAFVKQDMKYGLMSP